MADAQPDCAIGTTARTARTADAPSEEGERVDITLPRGEEGEEIQVGDRDLERPEDSPGTAGPVTVPFRPR